ncbi:hypothetical protein CJD36_022315 [Flavipsychrobacter stenotrophus]|uniref:Uncharacterized protein n=1 Tax=Flavipsychrobacter stenotrophus TaxID=2077091 RepID=A0A2S7SQ82_9BACT|nr:hypothetical protein CJD36_022315 [Flavipsychrobacter stenotrophus]
MQPTKLSHRIFAVSLLLFCTTNTQAQNVEVLFTGIKSTKGQIIVKIFTNEKNFKEDKALKAVRFKKMTLLMVNSLAK